jgi:magnesium transporter
MVKRKKKAGLPPGTVVFTGNRKVEKVLMHYLKYDVENLEAKTLSNHSELAFYDASEEIIDWYDIRGLHDTELIEAIGEKYEVHPLILEDVVDIHQRPKYEEYPKGIFLIIDAIHFDTEKLTVTKEQVGIYFRKGLLLSFQESETDLFEAVRKRIQSGRGRIRQRGADYLAYALVDNIVDNYFSLSNEIEEEIDSIEEGILLTDSHETKERIHRLKRELMVIRKSIAPLREAISRFSKAESAFVQEHSTVYIRDLYDHTIQIMDIIENYRDMLNGLQDLYLSEISFRMNQVMQVLTIITTIFVPLSFLAGLYGMNFEYIPELKYRYSYFILLSVMFLILIGSLVYFRKKKWF